MGHMLSFHLKDFFFFIWNNFKKCLSTFVTCLLLEDVLIDLWVVNPQVGIAFHK